ncbi:2,5-dioxovalerate dehydrogenase [Mycobacterium sp. IS-1496]|uniref:aldehyde dehydrogenase (NADP(+)) n=1 Tax=Mycobacterium sp. IS-1496 TaxID=1772284 RepID=UPI00074150E7|nr:aldehyde dehydrogenase (NADP(+)) [Mycobacterium sp. IS-1496]KUI35320.1 2,5-dioxovalerate dehydrogenase [Mycobacterium sp. IS-1496]
MTAAPKTEPTGRMLIAGAVVRGAGAEIRGFDPATGTELEPGYRYGDISNVDAACAAAAEAFGPYRSTPAGARADFLEAIADGLVAITDDVVARAHAESGLPHARLTSELGRTCGQLRLFAAVLREGSWNGVRIDTAQPDRTPLPRPDLRQRAVPLGPVAVFGASNFPLAFSVAGGDTASALAAGCPVVVKAHDAHPGTSELAGRVITDAVAAAGLPAGTFSLLNLTKEAAIALVTDPRVKAVGFTGSRAGGLALIDAAARRREPIPVYAEMSAVNPVFLLDGALAGHGADLGRAFVGSLTLGSGQFCTNPGLIVAVDGPGLDTFVDAAREALGESAATAMLTPGIAENYRAGVEALAGEATLIARGSADGAAAVSCRAALFGTDAVSLLGSTSLQAEVFGAAGLIVRCADFEEMKTVAAGVEGQLTATLHADPSDHGRAAELLPVLELKAGRILFNGWPTGVEVTHAMVHGGPFPATSDSRTTSVGSRAIERFLRAVCYQNAPKALLPSAIADGNPDRLWRRVDGELTRGSTTAQ